jgi:hypothetical protein
MHSKEVQMNKIYIAYAGSDETDDYVNNLVEKLKTAFEEIEIIHYKDDKRKIEVYNLSEYFKELGSADRIIVVVDDKYLTQSIYCAEEISYIMSNGNIEKRVIPILKLSEDLSKENVKNGYKNKVEEFINNYIEEHKINEVERHDRIIRYRSYVYEFIEVLYFKNWAVKQDEYELLTERIKRPISKGNVDKIDIKFSCLTFNDIKKKDQIVDFITIKLQNNDKYRYQYNFIYQPQGYAKGLIVGAGCRSEIENILKSDYLIIIVDSIDESYYRYIECVLEKRNNLQICIFFNEKYTCEECEYASQLKQYEYDNIKLIKGNDLDKIFHIINGGIDLLVQKFIVNKNIPYDTRKSISDILGGKI